MSPGPGTPVLAGRGRLNQLCAAADTLPAMSLPGGVTQHVPPPRRFSREVGKSQGGWRRGNLGLFLSSCLGKAIKGILGTGLF